MKPYDKSLIDFLSGESGFIVPPFQRRYEWSKDQCEILFNDIFKTAYINSVPGHESIHFFGTFTVSSDGESPFIIADGQQRIITSMLFLAACMHSPYCPEKLKGEIQKILFSGTDPRLQQNKLDQGTYTKIIQGKAISSQEEKKRSMEELQIFHGTY
ncbi:MAG: DUF262 domain-containing protein [Aeriscardovia sp.]|nr:DUF262 domain-containing protein [Aeriscardovia sp.]